MTDRELLEAAARAAGIQLRFLSTGSGPVPFSDGPWRVGEWNPLTDDGDALRLAVKIGEPFVVRTSCVTTMGGLREDFNPAMPDDDLRAVRRIVVRAAAAMETKPISPPTLTQGAPHA
jgi:hypothetical protein